MQLASPRRPLVLIFGMAMAASASFAGAADAQDAKKGNENFKSIRFNSYDGVELSGTFYPKSGAKDRDACVLLLHNFDKAKGGDSHKDGWDHLAEELQKDGYAVLSFDFRGFGQSKQVSKELFWDRTKSRHNQMLRGAARQPENIAFSEFPSSYYPYLVNDIVAARSYLDRKNDAREVNSSNLILIGAGEGATLGSLWLAAEAKRKRSRGFLPDGRPDLDEAEVRDVACAVWLTYSRTVGNISMSSRPWLIEAAVDHKIPIGFLYGGDDKESKALASEYLSSIKGAAQAKRVPIPLTGSSEIPGTKLRGSQLLTNSLTTEKLVKSYLDNVMEKRGAKESRSRDPLKTTFVWSFRTGPPVTAKTDKEEMIHIVPLAQLGVSSGS